jgi:hypothetical protein
MGEQSFEPDALSELRERIYGRGDSGLSNATALAAGWEAIEIDF